MYNYFIGHPVDYIASTLRTQHTWRHLVDTFIHVRDVHAKDSFSVNRPWLKHQLSAYLVFSIFDHKCLTGYKYHYRESETNL